MQKCMQKISKQNNEPGITTFIDHRRKGLWQKKLRKTSVIKFIKKEFWGSLKLKFRSLYLKIRKKHWQEKRVSLIYWERVTSLVNEMHLRVPVET